MILQTGGEAFGEISTRSSVAAFARCKASRMLVSPIFSPSLPIRNTMGEVMSWLVLVRLVLIGKVLLLKD